ncbi:hypothetical protein LUZ60_002941 [Juncus effusus]|nr:hypothetical protein LUZ60_002941 [Juncus effusus]
MVKLDRAAAAFRRKLLEVLMCGGRGVNARQKRSQTKCEIMEPKVKSERLVELMMAAEEEEEDCEFDVVEVAGEIAGVDTVVHCDGNEVRRREREEETRRKLEVFEEFQRADRVLLSDGNGDCWREAAAAEIAGVDTVMHCEENEDQRRVEEEEETRRKVEVFEEFQRVASELQSNGNADRRSEAAAEIRRLAKGDVEARETLAMLGVIPPLIAMLDPESDLESQISALYAILNLGVGNDMNKAAIVKAGAVHKMLSLKASNSSILEANVANFLSLSALDSNKQIIGSSGAIPFLLTSLRENPNCKIDAMRAIFNLSILSTNSTYLLESNVMHVLLSTIGDSDEITNHALATISNLISSSAEARKTLSGENDSFSILIDVLSWTDCPSCQEKSAYILMIMAHKSRNDRAVMAEAGIASALLELTLLGTPLAQKRACRILEILREKKGKEISAPMEIREGKGKEKVFEEGGFNDERKAVKHLVQQSLQSNLRRIAKRANLPEEILPLEHGKKTLIVSSTSKSLTF